MFAPRGVKKFPKPLFPSESPPKTFPMRGQKRRREIIPDFFKRCFSQDLGRVIKTLFLVSTIRKCLEIVSTKTFIPQKVRSVVQLGNHRHMLPLFPRALNSPIKHFRAMTEP